jgi:hypothetical protein
MSDHAVTPLTRPQELWAEARTTLAQRGLIARCAWCERFRLGNSWVNASEIGGTVDPLEQTTHTICSLCDHRLRVTGLAR